MTLCLAAVAFGQDQVFDLTGKWRLALDRDDAGQEQKWFGGMLPGSDVISLPGSLQLHGFGDNPGLDTAWIGDVREDEWSKPKYAPYRSADNYKWPFWLQPEKHYKGAAWYQRTVNIPADWQGKRVTLTLERPHWETRVWVDSTSIGSNNSLSTAHTYDLSEVLTLGKHTLTIRVNNRMIINVGPNSHSVSDHTQSNWNGLVGKLELKAQAPAWVEDMQVYPDLKKNAIKVVAQLSNSSGTAQKGQLMYELLFNGKSVSTKQTSDIILSPEGARHETLIELNGLAKTWDEFNPDLYTLKSHLKTAAGVDERTTVFGMREVGVEGTRVTLNSTPIYFRGTLECAIFPLTGYPPTDIESWKRIVRICKAHGLNHIRFHSWCPPKAAFIAADELGFYYQVECASWANQGAEVGSGQPLDQWLYEEGERITRAYANHPSFVLMAYGNEPGGKKQKEYLGKWCTYWKEKEPRALHTSGSGWPLILESDFHNTPNPRIQQWGQGLRSVINSSVPQTEFDFSGFVGKHPEKPSISHEIGQWCVYPDFDEIKKYTGVLKAKNFEVFRDFLKEKNMEDQAHDFLMASGKLQTLCYKADIEAALRTPGFGGFQLLDLHDFPGQGTALVGVLDPFWDSKPYVTPAEYHRFSGSIVPLARLPRRVFASSDSLTAQIDVSQFGAADLESATVTWALLDRNGKAVKQGGLQKAKLTAGDLINVGDIAVDLSGLPVPAEYSLEVAVENTDAVNDWDIWVYPDTVNIDSDKIKVAESLDDDTVAYLEQGGKVLLAIKPGLVKTDVVLGFSSIFWNTAWTGGQPPHTLGVLCDPEHPALARFPTEYHSNWQWSKPIQHAATMELDNLPKELKPIIQIVPDWFAPKKLALAFEARVGKGSVLVCSIDIVGNMEQQLEQRQLRSSLIQYMESDAFKPKVELSADQISSLVNAPPRIQQLGAKITSSSAERGNEAARVADGKPATIWHSQYTPMKPLPQDIMVELPKELPLNGLAYLPRQDRSNGRIEEYAVYLSRDGKNWGKPIMQGTLDAGAGLKELKFDKPVTGRFIKLEVLKGSGGYASIAELDIL